MRTKEFLLELDASLSHTSDEFEIKCSQDMRFLIHAVKSGTDGDGKLFVDEGFATTNTTITWSQIEDPATWDDFFLMDSAVTAVKDSYFMGDKMRVRYEPNGTTTGTITVKMVYKTKV